MADGLILIEGSIDEEAWRRFVDRIPGEEPLYLLADSQDRFSLPLPKRVRNWVDEEFWPMGQTHSAIWADAVALFESISASPALEPLRHELVRHGIDLWDASRVQLIEIEIYPRLRRFTQLTSILSSHSWSELHVFDSGEGLRSMVEAVVRETRFSGPARFYAPEGNGGTAPRKAVTGLRRLLSIGRRLLDSLRPAHLGVNGKSILYLVRRAHTAYSDTTLPIVKILEREFEPLLISDATRQRGEDGLWAGHELLFPLESVSLPGWWKTMGVRNQLRRAWPEIASDPAFHLTFRWKNRDTWPFLEEPIRRALFQQIPAMVAWVESVSRILERAHPAAALILPDAPWPGRVTAELAQQRGIPTLTVQPALYIDHPSLRRVYTDRLAVIDAFARDVFVHAAGVAPEAIEIVGLPRWDDLVSLDHQPRALKVREELGLKDSTRLVTIATQYIPLDLTLRLIQAVRRSVAGTPDTRLVLKIHPAETLEKYRMAVDADSGDSEVFIVKQIDLHGLLKASDLVVTGFSNVAVEAALLDQAVIVANLSGEPDWLPFANNGIAAVARTEEEIESLVRRILEDDVMREGLARERQRFFSENPQLRDGRAGERVANILRDMVKPSRPGNSECRKTSAVTQ